MSYQVLARKWRPSRFEELVGQEPVVRALRNALETGRIHHAYLLTGTRGVGKTTIARILAKSLNCERGLGPSPCGECDTCMEIADGRFVDLIEVDAASRTKVEDTRDLLDNVPYAPVRGRYKVYLIDEVHMFSRHSFNALLKTLEEPPPHARFVLATTDPEQLPVTILSRCLQFNLKRLDADQIAAKLGEILVAESIAAEPPALAALARAADGSMRDALSLLDQAIAFGGGAVKAADVDTMLGTLGVQHLENLLAALHASDGKALLRAVDAVYAEAADSARVLESLALLLQKIAIAQTVPEAMADDQADAGLVQRFASELAPDVTQLWYQIALHGRRDLELAPDPHAGLVMSLIRMLAFQPDDAVTAVTPAKAPVVSDAPPPAPPTQGSVAPHPSADALPAWADMIGELALSGIAQELALRLNWLGLEAGVVRFELAEEHETMQTRSAQSRLSEALSQRLGQPVKLQINLVKQLADTPVQQREQARDARQQSAEQAIENDPHVAALQETFGARIVPDSTRPADSD